MASASDLSVGGMLGVQEVLGVYAVCEVCGCARRVDDFSECMACKWKGKVEELNSKWKREFDELDSKWKREVDELNSKWKREFDELDSKWKREVDELKSQNVATTLELREMTERVKHLGEEMEGIRQVISVRPKVTCEGGREVQPVVGESKVERRDSQKEEVRAPRTLTSKSDVAPCAASDKGWKVVGRKGACVPQRLPPQDQVVCRNSFHALSELNEEEVKVVGNRKVDDKSLPTGNILVVGDSQVRYLDRTFCARDKKRRTRVCFPGAGIGHVSERIEACMANEGTKPIVCLSAGGNDIGRVHGVELLRRFKEVLGKVRDRGGIPVVCGILPRRGVSWEWLSKAIAVNCRLADHCMANGWTFINNWHRFFGMDHLYQRDGVHLSQRGYQFLADILEDEVGALKGFLV